MPLSRPSTSPQAKRASEMRFTLIASRISGAAREGKTDELEKRLRENGTSARLAFGALVALCTVLASIAFVTTHVDLLLNNKIRVFGNVVEIPRDWGMSIGAVLLVFLQYEALSLNARLRRQYELWWKALLPTGGHVGRRLSWMSGGLISDLYLTGSRYVVLRTLARVILTLGLCIFPLLTLTFLLAVAMPAHSELLSTTIRAAATGSAILAVWAHREGLLARSRVDLSSRESTSLRQFNAGTSVQTWWRNVAWRRFAWLPVPLVIACTQILVWHVFLWPGEAVQRATTSLLPDAFVWGSDEDSDKVRWWFWWSESTKVPVYSNPELLRETDVSKLMPSASRIDWGIANRYSVQAPGSRSLGRDERTSISTQVLRYYIWVSLGDRFSPNLRVRDADLVQLSADQKAILGGKSASEEHRARFAEALQRIPTLDLRRRDLRFATFDHVWMPKVALPPASRRAGMVLTNCNLQGASLFRFGVARCATCIVDSGTLGKGLDISGATITDSRFNSGIRNVSARYSHWDAVDVVGWVTDTDFRGSELANVAWLRSDPSVIRRPSVIANSDFSGAHLYHPQFHNTIIRETALDGANIDYPLLLGRVGMIDSRMRFARFAFPEPELMTPGGRGSLAINNVVVEGTSFWNAMNGSLVVTDPWMRSDEPPNVLINRVGFPALRPRSGPQGFFIHRVANGRETFPSKLISYRPDPFFGGDKPQRFVYWRTQGRRWFECTEPPDSAPRCIPAESRASGQEAARIFAALCATDFPWPLSAAALASEANLRTLLGPNGKTCMRRASTPVGMDGSGSRFVDTFATP